MLAGAVLDWPDPRRLPPDLGLKTVKVGPVRLHAALSHAKGGLDLVLFVENPAAFMRLFRMELPREGQKRAERLELQRTLEAFG